MPQFNVAEAKAQFSRLVRKALSGEEVIIAKDNKPVLIPLGRAGKPRDPGTAKGRIWMAADFARPRTTSWITSDATAALQGTR